MGQRVSFIRLKNKHLPSGFAEKNRLIEQVFNPEIRDQSVVINIDKALQGLAYLMDGKIREDAAQVLVELWGYDALLYNKEELNLYYQDKDVVSQWEKKLAVLDEVWITENYNATEWNDKDIYPKAWDPAQGYEGLGYLCKHAAMLQHFYHQAAQAKEVVIAIPN